MSMSITTIFIRFWRHFVQFLSRLTSDSTTFKVAVSHFNTQVESYKAGVEGGGGGRV